MTSWFTRLTDSAAPTGRFGPLEWRVLESLWERADHASVRDLQPLFPEIAYTTLMTTLDRLFRKGVLNRIKRGRAFLYEPSLSRPEFESARAASALQTAIAGNEGALTPLMSFFVDAVSQRDSESLNELEALVRARRAELESKRS
jgi:predicted transcriptional regulator